MNKTDGSFSIHVTAKPFVTRAEGRQFDLIVKSWGAKVVLPVIQGVPAGMTDVEALSVKAQFVGDQIQLTYADVESVSIVDANGKVYGSYMLPAAGNYVIPAGNLAKGVYMLQFKGAKGCVVKLVK
ncbi:MAG: T9SS type A sorting domain-containing protein [Bacteroidales bacterium]